MLNSLNNLKIVESLGSGLSGDVFLAKTPHKELALKFLKTSAGVLSKEETIQNFKEEFSLLKKLSHPHIAFIEDFGYDSKDDRYYFTSEFIQGKNLFEASEGKSIEEIEALLIQTLRALEYLHSHAIFHFDLKPQNILVKKEGNEACVKMIDFGLAGYKPKGKMAGTPSYMPPEIILGEKPDGRADLYSLGIVFYECFTRQNPFRADSLSETLQRQQNLRVQAPSNLREGIPEYLDRIFSKLLQKNPNERFLHASAVIKEINQLSGKNYPIETPETLLSYLPGEGIFIGRHQQLESFKKIFEDFSSSTSPLLFKKMILLTGKQGLGKTRLLKEFRFYAQLHNANVFQYKNQLPKEVQSPLMLIADDLDSHALQKILTFFASSTVPLLILGAIEENPHSLAEGEVWEISSFTVNEVEQYLSSLTGLHSPPRFLLEEIIGRTQGNPLFISELLKKLIQKGLLLDETGRWKASSYEDLEINFSKIEVPLTLQEFLSKEFSSLQPKEKELLRVLAVYGQEASVAEIEAFGQASSAIATLQKLLELGLLSRNESLQCYDFKNPSFKEVILQALSEAEAEHIHANVASVLKNQTLREKEYLYHLGRSGQGPEALSALIRLGDQLLDEGNPREAKENYEIAYSKKRLESLEKINIGLKYGDALLKEGELDAAEKLFEKIRQELKQIKSKAENIPSKIDALEKLGAVYLKRHHPGSAREIFASALTLLDEYPLSPSKKLVLENYMGRAKMVEGNLNEALKIFSSSFERWEKDLNESEKKQVLNNDLATVYHLQQNFPAALKQFQKDLEFYKSIHHHFLTARTHYHLAELYSSLKQASETIEHYKACVEISKAHHYYELLLRAYNGLGNVFNIKKEAENAIRYYERALTLSQKTQDLNSQAAICTNLGILYNEGGHPDLALPQVKQAIFLLERNLQKTSYQLYFLIRAKIEMGDIQRKFKKFEEARDALKEAQSLVDQNEHQKNQLFWVHASLSKLYADQDRPENASKEFEKMKSLLQSQDEDQQNEFRLVEKMLKGGGAPEISPSLQNITLPREISGNGLPSIEKEYEYILQLNQFLNAEHQLDFLLKTILNYALELSGAERALILLLNEKEELELKAYLNAEPSSNLAEISTNIAKKVLQSGDYIETDDATGDQRFNEYQSVLILKLRSILCLPIYSRNKTVGVLYLDNRYRPGAFKKSNLKVLQAFCNQGGIAIENAKLISEYERIQEELKIKLAKVEDEASTYQAILEEESINIPTKYSYDKIIAKSKSMHDIFRMLDKITETLLAVFIHGETGTGKELIAKALHYNNKLRSEKRFVAINCGAIPSNLMESELFGHKAGSFTGAMKDKKGLFAEAHGGTLFLDEIAELDLNLQVKLLRVLEENEYTPVGETKPVSCDVRIIAASHKNLEEEIKSGKFREDLFYRICQIKIDLPPLRNRKEDIPLLAEKFTQIYKKEHGIERKIKIAPSFMKKMLEYSWPGNVRELENVISVSTALADENELQYESLPSSYGIRRALEHKGAVLSPAVVLSPSSELPQISGPKILIDRHNHYNSKLSWKDYEKLIVAKAYQSYLSNPTQTAQALDVSVATFYKRIKDFDLNNSENPIFRDPFSYDASLTLKGYVKKIFHAAQEYSGNHPYTAIKWLGVSQGYYYKILKEE